VFAPAFVLSFTPLWLSFSCGHGSAKQKACCSSLHLSQFKVSGNRHQKVAKKLPTKNAANTKLSNLGFSLSKCPEYKLGTKLLLDTSISDNQNEIPEKVVDHPFVYEIVKIMEDGKTLK
jgi:hypothetical protein